jgi:DnaK suppressor protein
MYLTKEQLQEIKQSIENQRQEILEKLNQRNAETYEPEVRGDDADIANSEGIALTLERLQSRDVRLLKKLDEAARWVESEDFGYCESCGEEIGFKRLLARPAARQCIECKQNEEQRERGYYHPRPRKPPKNNHRDDEGEE